jgi:hypothetical protein
VQNRPEKKKKDATGQGVIYEGYQRNIKGILEEYKRGDGGKTRWWAGNLSPSTHWSSEREFKKKKKKKRATYGLRSWKWLIVGLATGRLALHHE